MGVRVGAWVRRPIVPVVRGYDESGRLRARTCALVRVLPGQYGRTQAVRELERAQESSRELKVHLGRLGTPARGRIRPLYGIYGYGLRALSLAGNLRRGSIGFAHAVWALGSGHWDRA